MENLGNLGQQLNINFDQHNLEMAEEKDKAGNKREDYEKRSKIMDKSRITFKNGEFFIDDKLAKEWIKDMEDLDEKHPSDFRRGLN